MKHVLYTVITCMYSNHIYTVFHKKQPLFLSFKIHSNEKRVVVYETQCRS